MMRRIGSGISRIKAISKVRMAGVPQPMMAIGPKTWRFFTGGKTVLRSLTICGALRIGSTGNRIEPRVPFLRPLRSTSVITVRFTPSNPPIPVKVKPNPS
jgi:hypothetical protein